MAGGRARGTWVGGRGAPAETAGAEARAARRAEGSAAAALAATGRRRYSPRSWRSCSGSASSPGRTSPRSGRQRPCKSCKCGRRRWGSANSRGRPRTSPRRCCPVQTAGRAAAEAELAAAAAAAEMKAKAAKTAAGLARARPAAAAARQVDLEAAAG